MLLGLHTYSLHLHGMGQNWGGFKLQWEPLWDIFDLMDEAKKLGLDGLHLTAADLGSTDRDHLGDVRRAAEERGLFLEYNFSLDASEYDPGADGREEARRREYQAVVDSIRFAREELGVGQGSIGQIQ